MSVWRNEDDFMTNMDSMLSEFYIKDKKITTPTKLNVQIPKHNKTWYESDSDDDYSGKDNPDVYSKCPSMEPLDTLQIMDSIRMQVRNVIGNRNNNDVLEIYNKMDQEHDNESCTINEIYEATTPVEQSQNGIPMMENLVKK